MFYHVCSFKESFLNGPQATDRDRNIILHTLDSKLDGREGRAVSQYELNWDQLYSVQRRNKQGFLSVPRQVGKEQKCAA